MIKTLRDLEKLNYYRSKTNMKYLTFGCGLSCLVATIVSSSALAIPNNPPTQGASFAQLSSKVVQQPGGFVQFESKDSLVRMMATKNSVTVSQDGSYLIIASPQVTATKDGGCLDAWITVNSKDVQNSGVRICQAKTGNTNVVVSQVIMYLKRGDTIQIKTSGKDTKLDAILSPKSPNIPSIILTVTDLY
jgi:hypothetical protein